jgi:hypothetical protein
LMGAKEAIARPLSLAELAVRPWLASERSAIKKPPAYAGGGVVPREDS